MNKKIKLKAPLFLGGLLVLLCANALALPDSPAIPVKDAEMRQILGDLEKKMKQIENMQTGFVQKKKLKTFQHEVVLKGTIAMQKPNRFAWRIESPIRYSIVFKDGKIYQWNEDTDRVEVLSMSAAPVFKIVIEQMQTWFYGSYTDLLAQYDIRVFSKNPLVLEFTPHKEALSAPMIQAITIQFRHDQSYIESIRIMEKSGDQSLMIFTGTLLNTGIDASVWEMKQHAV